jgi:type VI secretion system protein ImpH
LATASRQSTRALAARLFAQPYAFDFEQAVRLLEHLNPAAIRLGTGSDPRREVVRLHGPLAPLFPSSAISQLTAKDNDGLPQMHVHLFGLGGPDGPLPYAYQEWLQQRQRQKDTAPAAFFNVFQHRQLSQLYRCLGKYRLAPGYTAPASGPAVPLLRALVGLLPTSLRERQAIPDAILLSQAALLANRRRSTSGFIRLLHDIFSIRAHIEPFQGRWQTLPVSSLTCIGHVGRDSHARRSGRNAVLGRSAVAGRYAWNQHAAIRLCIEPLPLVRYRRFLPDGDQHACLRALAMFYFGPELEIELKLQLSDEARLPSILSRVQPLRLGWTSWLESHRVTSRHATVNLTPVEGGRDAQAA